jgi:dipeptidase E
LNHPEFAENRMAEAEKWAAGLGCPAYAIDDEHAILVDGSRVEPVPEGEWWSFPG